MHIAAMNRKKGGCILRKWTHIQLVRNMLILRNSSNYNENQGLIHYFYFNIQKQLCSCLVGCISVGIVGEMMQRAGDIQKKPPVRIYQYRQGAGNKRWKNVFFYQPSVR